MKIGFVMPAYNEELLLAETVGGIVPVCDKIVVVDDGSADRTPQVMAELEARHAGKVQGIRHPKNRGVGAAVLTGIEALLAQTDIEAIGIIAADNQCDPSLIAWFVEILETHPEIDIAKGSRFLHRESLGQMPRFRYWGNRFISVSMQIILGYWGMSDVLHGYLLARRSVLEQMRLDRIAAGYDLENTMMTEFRRLRTAFALVPSPSRYGREKSKIVLGRQIPRTLAKMTELVGLRLTSGTLRDRSSLVLLLAAVVAYIIALAVRNLVAVAVATGLLVAGIAAMRLTSPSVRVFERAHS